MGLTEASYQASVRRRLEREGAVVLNIHGSGMGANGTPDLYVASKAFTGWLELKVEKNQTTPLQVRAMAKLINPGYVPAMVLRGVEGAPSNGNFVEMPDNMPVADLVDDEPWLPQLAQQAQYCIIWWNNTNGGKQPPTGAQDEGQP